MTTFYFHATITNNSNSFESHYKLLNCLYILTMRILIADFRILLPYIVGLLGLIVAVAEQSRAFTIGFLVGGFVVYAQNNRKSKKFYVAGLLVIVLSLVTATVFIKTDSSLGRLLIYKISFQIFQDNWQYGIGLGEFERHYLPQQAIYFSESRFTNKEVLLADNTYFAFNDYWQFIIEIGVLGFLVLAIIFYAFYSIVIKSVGCNRSVAISSNCVLLLVAIFTAAFFTHVFEKIIFQVMALMCLILLCLLKGVKKWMDMLFFCFVIMLSLVVATKFVKSTERSYNYDVAFKLYLAGLKNECRTELLKLPIDNNKRAVLYLQVLMQSYNLKYEHEIRSIIRLYPNAELYNLLGNYYLLNNKNSEAEAAYLLAINMVPNRFVPRQALLRMYVSQKKNAKAQQIAKEIVNLDVKVHSAAVENIKNEAVNFLTYPNKYL